MGEVWTSQPLSGLFQGFLYSHASTRSQNTNMLLFRKYNIFFFFPVFNFCIITFLPYVHYYVVFVTVYYVVGLLEIQNKNWIFFLEIVLQVFSHKLMEGMNVCTKLKHWKPTNVNPHSICWDISTWTKVVDSLEPCR